jgi:cholesterol oxidase
LAQRAFGYENLLVCDGSVIPANPGVNPSLTIMALTEHAMTFVPPAAGREPPTAPLAREGRDGVAEPAEPQR